MFLRQIARVEKNDFVKWNERENGDDPRNHQAPDFPDEKRPPGLVLQGSGNEIAGDKENRGHDDNIEHDAHNPDPGYGGGIIDDPEPAPEPGGFIHAPDVVENHQKNAEGSEVVQPMNSFFIRRTLFIPDHRVVLCSFPTGLAVLIEQSFQSQTFQPLFWKTTLKQRDCLKTTCRSGSRF